MHVLEPIQTSSPVFESGREHKVFNSDSLRTPLISVIIPAHNEEAYLPATLEALERQTFRDFEVIVVANKCTDRTVAVAHQKCRIVYQMPEKGLSRARNAGAKLARGSMLVFLDADTVMAPDALMHIAREFTDEFSSGTLKGIPDESRFSFRFIYFWKNFVHRFGFHRGSSGVILCWKQGFDLLGGFDEKLQLRENSKLISELGQMGRYCYVKKAEARTSMRRYSQRGVFKTSLFWFKVWLQSFFSDLRNRDYESVR